MRTGLQAVRVDFVISSRPTSYLGTMTYVLAAVLTLAPRYGLAHGPTTDTLAAVLLLFGAAAISLVMFAMMVVKSIQLLVRRRVAARRGNPPPVNLANELIVVNALLMVVGIPLVVYLALNYPMMIVLSLAFLPAIAGLRLAIGVKRGSPTNPPTSE